MSSIFYENIAIDPSTASTLSLNIGILILAPLERIKILLQTSPVNPHNKMKARFYNGIYDCFKKVKKREGILSFWRGSSLHFTVFNLFLYNRSFLQLSIDNFHPDVAERDMLAFYQEEKNIGYIEQIFIEKNEQRKNFLWKFFGLFFLVHPFNVARVNHVMYVSRNPESRVFGSWVAALPQIYKRKGIKGLYRGFLPQIFLYFPLFFGSQYYLENVDVKFLREKYNFENPENDQGEKMPFLEFCNNDELWITGFASLAYFGLLCMDNLSVRRMVVNMRKDVPKNRRNIGNGQYSIFSDLRKISKVSGFRKIYRGGLCNFWITMLAGFGLGFDLKSLVSELGNGDA